MIKERAWRDMSITVTVNTIRNRGLADIIEQHISVDKLIIDLGIDNIIQVFPGAHYIAINTVCWFLYGVKPIAYPKK